MSSMQPPLAPGWKLTGRLYDTEDPELLDSQMLEATHPDTAILIYAGWEPEEDPSGRYVIGALDGCDTAYPPFQAGSLQEAAAWIAFLAHIFSPPAIDPLRIAIRIHQVVVNDGIVIVAEPVPVCASRSGMRQYRRFCVPADRELVHA